MRTLGLLAAVAMCGCASGGGGGAAPVTQDISVGGGAFGTGTLTVGGGGSGPNTNELAMPTDQVWKVLPAAFDSISMPVTRLDPRTHTIGNEGLKIRQRLGKTPLSRYFDCGTTQIGANADSYELYIVLLVQVTPSGTGSRLTTQLNASARPLTFSQGYSACSSRGALETRLLNAIKAQLK